MSDSEKRRVTRETLEEIGACDMTVFTDGSVEGGVRNGGAACVAEVGGEKVVRRRPAGRWCSSYAAEVCAMREAVELVAERRPRRALICTDSQALVVSLQSGRAGRVTEVEELKERMMVVSRESELVVQWVPAHAGVEGNEWADQEAKKAREESQEGVGVWMDAAKSVIKREVRYVPELDERAREVFLKKREGGGLSRREQVLVTQLRAGHCPSTAYYRQRVGLQEEAVCERCGEEEGKDHWLWCVAVRRVRESCGLVNFFDLCGEGRLVRFLRRAYPEWLG